MNVSLSIVNIYPMPADTSALPIRVSVSGGWTENGPGWQAAPAGAADCWLIAGSDLAASDLDTVIGSRLPLILAPGDADVPAAWLDQADGFVLPGDDAAAIAAVLARAVAPTEAGRVADVSDGLARTITALSAEPAPVAIDARLVRRLLKLRRDRERYFPAEIFADPAWDMLLDLTAARLEGKRVPVSSLCIAAAVPTTTALRWIRSLTEAGLFERYTDPTDARRSHIEIAEPAAAAMLNYLRAFSEAFAVR